MNNHKWWGALHETGGVIILPRSNRSGIERTQDRHDIVSIVDDVSGADVDSAIANFRQQVAGITAKLASSDRLWWGYEHKRGEVKIHKFFDMQDVSNKRNSIFCNKIVGPIEADNRVQAERLIRKLLGKEEAILHGKAKRDRFLAATTRKNLPSGA